eukprot:2532069-Pyramimonas_sp.AAC.1
MTMFTRRRQPRRKVGDMTHECQTRQRALPNIAAIVGHLSQDWRAPPRRKNDSRRIGVRRSTIDLFEGSRNFVCLRRFQGHPWDSRDLWGGKETGTVRETEERMG